MTNHDQVSGEIRLKRREQRIYAIKGALFAVGLVTGGIVGYLAGEDGFAGEAKWPTSLAVALVITYLSAIGIGSWLLRTLCDEVERLHHYKAISFAGLIYIIGYPVWFTLWKGGLLPEPSHWLLFAAFYLGLLGAYLFYRFR